jgi:hypothetical protein
MGLLHLKLQVQKLPRGKPRPKGKYQSIGLGRDDFWAHGRTIYSLNGILEHQI